MSARRSRIKGIANIPQRRKAPNEENDVNIKNSSKNDSSNHTEAPLENLQPTVNQISNLENKEPEIVENLDNAENDENENEGLNINNLENSHLHPTENIENVFQKPIPVISNTPHSDSEYPLPPPSPSKANRSRIKAIPRLAYRKTSFSASESEDESRKINRIRNDSVCSTTSIVTESIADCFSPQRPKEAITAVQPKKITIRSEQTRKLAEARKEFIRRFGASKPERHRLTMMDLIFYNPDSNPMTGELTRENDPENENVDDPTSIEETVDDPGTEEGAKSDEENAMPVPQIKIGPSGEIILDEKSLVIERKEVQRQREEMQKAKVIDADQFKTGYGIYKKHKRSKYWTHSETLHFYKALNTIGTDFMLMCELFPNRTRRDLKMKFKKEEKVNRHLVDRALMQPCSFDFEDLKNEIEIEERETEELKRQNEEQKRKKEARIKELQRIMLEKTQKRKEEEQRKEREFEMNARKMYAPKTPPITFSQEQEHKQTERTQEEREAVKEKSKKVKIIRDSIRKPKPPKKPRKEKLSIQTYMSDSDADESDLATQSESDDDIILPHKPTRSGRVPKVIQRYDNELSSVNTVMKRNRIPDHAQPNNVEPGSLMIITENGPNGEQQYKIYMVTPEQKATPLNLASDVVAKAIQLKKGVTAQNILTISSNVTDDEEMPEENNVTIPEDENVTTLKSSEENNLVSTDTESETPEENNVTIPVDENVTTLRSNIETNVTGHKDEKITNNCTEEKNLTIPADENITTLRSKKETKILADAAGSDQNSEKEDMEQSCDTINDVIKCEETSKSAEGIKVIATEPIVFTEETISRVICDENISDTVRNRTFVMFNEDEIQQATEKVKVIASQPSFYTKSETVITDDNNFILIGKGNNLTTNTEIVFEVNSDGSCSKLNHENLDNLRTDAECHSKEHNVMIPVDNSVGTLRTNV